MCIRDSLIFATALALTVACLVCAPSYEFSRLFTFSNYSGEAGANVWPPVSSAWVFALGLLLPIYTITGYDASAHTAEETKKAAHSVPRGIVSSVWWSALFGYIMLCAFILVLPSMRKPPNRAGMSSSGQWTARFRRRSRLRFTRRSLSRSSCAGWRL